MWVYFYVEHGVSAGGSRLPYRDPARLASLAPFDDTKQLAAWRRLWDLLLAPPPAPAKALAGAGHQHAAQEGAA
jgi:hypothetical protein